MSRPNLIKAPASFLLMALLIFLPRSGVSQGITLKIATLAPEGSAWVQTFDDLNAALKKKTGNAVRLKVYPGGVLGDETDMVRKMYVGQIQGAVLTSASLSGIFSEMDVFQIPFLFESYEEVDSVLGKMDAFFKKGFADKGYLLAAWSEGGFVRLMSTVPIAALDDLKKAKVWVWADAPMAKAIFDEAGISAIPLSLPDVLVGLQTGLVEVVYAPPTGAIALQWFTKTKYMTDVPLIYLVGGIVLKKGPLEKLSPAHRQVFMELCSEYMDKLKVVIRKENQEAIEVMVNHGLKIIRPSAAQIEGFKKVSQKAMQRQTGKSFSANIRDAVIGHLQEYRKAKK